METDASVTPKQNMASNSEAGSSGSIPTRIGDEINDISLDEIKKNTEKLEEYTYAQVLLEEKSAKDIEKFNKIYRPEVENVEDIANKTVETDIADKAQSMFSYLMNNNKVIKNDLAPVALETIKDSLIVERDKINEKYDLNNSEDLLKAQKEFSVIFNKKMDEELNNMPEYVQIVDVFQREVGEEMQLETRKRYRSDLGFEDEETQGMLDYTQEKFFQGAEQIYTGFKGVVSMFEGEAVNINTEKLQSIKDRIESGEIKPTDEISETVNAGRVSVIQTKTAEEWIGEYTELKEKSEISLNETLNELDNLKDGEEPTRDQILRLIREGKDDKLVSTISGLASGALEGIGARKTIAATLFGKKAVSSFLHGQVKQTFKNAGRTGKKR